MASSLRAPWPYNLGTYTLFAYETSGITGLDQLESITIYNGPPRGGALTGARQMLQIVAGLKEGEGYNGAQVNWSQSTNYLIYRMNRKHSPMWQPSTCQKYIAAQKPYENMVPEVAAFAAQDKLIESFGGIGAALKIGGKGSGTPLPKR